MIAVCPRLCPCIMAVRSRWFQSQAWRCTGWREVRLQISLCVASKMTALPAWQVSAAPYNSCNNRSVWKNTRLHYSQPKSCSKIHLKLDSIFHVLAFICSHAISKMSYSYISYSFFFFINPVGVYFVAMTGWLYAWIYIYRNIYITYMYTFAYIIYKCKVLPSIMFLIIIQCNILK